MAPEGGQEGGQWRLSAAGTPSRRNPSFRSEGGTGQCFLAVTEAGGALSSFVYLANICSHFKVELMLLLPDGCLTPLLSLSSTDHSPPLYSCASGVLSSLPHNPLSMFSNSTFQEEPLTMSLD